MGLLQYMLCRRVILAYVSGSKGKRGSFRLEGTPGDHLDQPPYQHRVNRPCSNKIAQGFVEHYLEECQEQRLHSLSHQPVAVLGCPHGEECFPYVQSPFSFYDHCFIYDHCLTDAAFSITKKNNKTRFKLAISRHITYLSFIHFYHSILGLTSDFLSPQSFSCLSTVCSPLTITNKLLCVYCIEMKNK